MLKRNYCYIGLGGNPTEYNERILKNKHTTPHQFITFQNKAKEGDIILLYHNKQGYIAYGTFTGKINVPKLGKDLAPDWNSTEVQKHIQIKKWNLFNQPTNKSTIYNGRRSHSIRFNRKKSNERCSDIIHFLLSKTKFSKL